MNQRIKEFEMRRTWLKWVGSSCGLAIGKEIMELFHEDFRKSCQEWEASST